uniref:BBE domain-containing protein n=1 Tax=Meloidogyne hapla TaxID=6305 RepID=A0A1I8B5S9_MELHA
MGSPPAISPPMVDDRVRAIAEVEDYLTRPRDKSYEKSSSFWNDPINSAKYPRLKALVHKCVPKNAQNSAPATSAESEI